MKPKLQVFNQFVAVLLPHELHYLKEIHQFQDEENKSILAQMVEKVVHNQLVHFDAEIDKRKYFALIQWVKHKLAAIDVDLSFEHINQLDSRIMTDTVDADTEKQLLTLLKFTPSAYYFVKVYDLMLNFRQYLLIRMRFREHKLVNEWLTNHTLAYERSKAIYSELHQASLEITLEYKEGVLPSRDWANWLGEVFRDKALDGLNRYFALVRLTFWHYNHRSYQQLLPFYDELEVAFGEGQFYSKRILANYYSNRLLLHAQLDQLEEAAAYGYLSIRGRNADYIYYINNLSAILLRKNMPKAALELMRQAFQELKHYNNFHNRTGFVALFVRCLNETAQPQEGEKYAENFLNAYKEQVFEQRWHLLFSSYLQALLLQQKFAKLIRIVRVNKLMEKEQHYRKRQHYLPALSWYYALALFREGHLEQDELLQQLKEAAFTVATDKHRKSQLFQLVDELKKWAPSVFEKLKSMLVEIDVV